jgi:rhamnosyltransferase
MNILVVLASYNGGKYIKEQINSILQQKDVEVKIHVFDDASDDETCQIVKEIQGVSLTKRSVGSGSAAINFLEALFELKSKNELINYDYIAFADQDDIWLENKLPRSIHFLKKGYDLYGSNLTIYKNGISTDEIVVKSQKQKKYDFLFEGGSAGCTYVFTPYLAEIICDNYKKIRTKTWKYFSHDWFIYFIARLNGLKTHIDKESNIYYRIHENNVHGEMNSNSIKAYIKRASFVFSNWYLESSKGYLQFCAKDSVEFKILTQFVSGYFNRIFILIMFNKNLMRSKLKFFKFFTINIFKF